eukprot:3097729-Pyramimonas_sp.AAC.1
MEGGLTVHAVWVESSTSRRSWPVIMSHGTPLELMESPTSQASSRSGPQYTPLLAPFSLSSAVCVLPLFVGPTWRITLLRRERACGNLVVPRGVGERRTHTQPSAGLNS